MISTGFVNPASEFDSGYTGPNTLGPSQVGKSIVLDIDTQGPLAVQLAQIDKSGNTQWSPTFTLPAGTTRGWTNVNGIRFKRARDVNGNLINAVPVVVATMYFEEDPDPAEALPFDEALALSGARIGGGVGMSCLYDSFPQGIPTTVDIPLPQNYAHIMGIITGRSELAGLSEVCNLQINGDGAAVYGNQELKGQGVTASAVATAAQTSLPLGNLPGQTALINVPGIIEFLIPNYASIAHAKVCLSKGWWAVTNTGGNNFATNQHGGTYFAGAGVSVNTLRILLASGFELNSRISIYGLSKLS